MGRLAQAENHPWLDLPYHSNPDEECPFQIVSSSKGELPACHGGKHICGSTSGFLIMADETSEVITMINSTTNAKLFLPQIPTSLAKRSTDIIGSSETRKFLVHKAVLSSPPDENPCDYILMVIYGEDKELAYYTARHQRWIKVQEAGRYYNDIIFYREGFYAVDEYGKVILCRSGFLPNIEEIAMPWLFRGSKIYLVGMEKELCVIIRFLKHNPSLGYETYNFQVHWLESYDERKKIENFEHWVFFVGRNESLALPIQDDVIKDVIKGNCIYFSDDNLDACKYGVTGGHDFGVFDIGEKSFKPLQRCTICHQIMELLD
ncbi:hypothetical protein DITRI_Ditri10aG0007700 [Diplodiscus trichospermus]